MFAGDLMFDRGIRYYASLNGGNDFIFEKISDLLLKNDLNVVNLEGPITSNKSVSSGTVPGSVNNYYFTFDPSVAKTLYNPSLIERFILDIGFDNKYFAAHLPLYPLLIRLFAPIFNYSKSSIFVNIVSTNVLALFFY